MMSVVDVLTFIFLRSFVVTQCVYNFDRKIYAAVKGSTVDTCFDVKVLKYFCR